MATLSTCGYSTPCRDLGPSSNAFLLCPQNFPHLGKLPLEALSPQGIPLLRAGVCDETFHSPVETTARDDVPVERSFRRKSQRQDDDP